MSYLNYEFFDEFKALDNLCRDIYGESSDNKLGVTLYLEDMDRKALQGSHCVPGWSSDYHQLRSARTLRNDLAHSRNSFSADICSQEDIDFIRAFRARILNQTDPIATLRKQATQPRPTCSTQTKELQTILKSPQTNQKETPPTYSHPSPRKEPSGCLGIVASLLIVLACIIAFLL